MGFLGTFEKFRTGLARTRDAFIGKVQQLASSKSRIDESVLHQLEEILIGGDVGVETTGKILDRLTRRVREDGYDSSERLVSMLKEEITQILGTSAEVRSSGPSGTAGQKPFVILVVGVNGVGKTTTIGKLASRYRQEGRSVMIGAADTFRAAANEQLEIWAQRAGVEMIRQASGADPAAVAYDALNSAVAKGSDVVIIDTAGRLHTKTNLMEELKKIRRVLDKRLSGAPHEVFLVLDAGTGQNGLQQARKFTDAVGVSGLILTKLDGTAKGGIVLAVCGELNVPVRFIGVGEGIDDLQPFDRQVFVDALFGTDELNG